jgi:transketolase
MMKMPKLGESVMPRISFGESLVELADDHPDMVVFDADVCASTQTAKFRDAYPDRFYQMGIAENNMVCAAAGMATLGFTPVVSTFSVFLAKRSLDQIRVSIAYPKLNVKLNGAYGGLPTGKAGATHSSVEDIAIMRCMPHMTVLVPADPVETKLAMELALKIDGPVYLRTVRCPVETIFPEDHKMVLGKGDTLHEGNDIAIISTGMMTPKTLEAVKNLASSKGIKARHIHLGTIKPLDKEIIIKAAKECGQIVTIENHSIHGGLGGAVTELLSEEYPCKVSRMGFPDIFMESGDNEAIFSKLKMNTADIEEKLISLLAK